MRKNLMIAIGDTLQALTSVPIGGETNCFDLDGAKACNVGDTVHVDDAAPLTAVAWLIVS
jgi:hypothetical protein